MSRQASTAQRPLTLTEELEKLEQSITLTLQEIDHNFSQAHRIVTSSILPLVEQYAEHSRDVWDGAKFWKQFFEASANVSLSGYEERPNEEGNTTQDEPTMTTEEDPSSASYDTPSSARHPTGADDLELTSLSLSSHSTPRAPFAEHNDTDIDNTITSSTPSDAKHRRPYHAQDDEDDDLPSTPATGKYAQHRNYNETTTPMSSSPFVPPVSHHDSASARRNPDDDPVLHHMLDKTYRVQATPLGKKQQLYGGSKFAITPKPSSGKYASAADDSPLSSPEMEAPRLRAEMFSPVKSVDDTPGTTGRSRRSHYNNNLRVTPQPGTSVLTPAKKSGGSRPLWDESDDELGRDFDDDDENFGPSPPKTMQFHIPQSRLMKTPAKEASKRIVEHLLYTAGANDTTDDIGDEQSPSLVRRMERLEDDTF